MEIRLDKDDLECFINEAFQTALDRFQITRETLEEGKLSEAEELEMKGRKSAYAFVVSMAASQCFLTLYGRGNPYKWIESFFKSTDSWIERLQEHIDRFPEISSERFEKEIAVKTLQEYKAWIEKEVCRG